MLIILLFNDVILQANNFPELLCKLQLLCCQNYLFSHSCEEINVYDTCKMFLC